MLVLFETPAGYALFKVLDKAKLAKAEDVYKHFDTVDHAAQVVKLKAFSKFEDTTSALAAATAICDGKLDKSLKSFLKEAILKGKDDADKVTLAVADPKLGGLIKEKLDIKCVYDNTILELMRGIRGQLESLVSGLSSADANAMKLGLSHSLCRYKLKFSPDKVDTMIIQAIALLDELDKELNTYAMRVREWYGWHFPEMGKIVNDNILYAKIIRKMSIRQKAKDTDFSDILSEDIEGPLKEAAEVSMGTEIAEEDVDNIRQLCEQVIGISEYRASLYEYLRNRMNAIAPNLTVMVGELVGARLIAHAGSLMSLAKHPASTVQILGAEKALFRALKTKHDTPKYGLIYHASLVGQAAPKLKGKVSRMLAAKTALGIRVDALGETEGVSIGFEGREKVELRLKQLEGGNVSKASGSAVKAKPAQEKYTKPTDTKTYNADGDVNMGDAAEDEKAAKKAAKKAKKAAELAAADAASAKAEVGEKRGRADSDDESEKKKSKKSKSEAPAEVDEEAEKAAKKAAKKAKKAAKKAEESD
jgi:nucleolar protein 58